MIEGTVLPGLEAVVPLEVRGPTGKRHRVEGVVDTGYNGCLILDPKTIRTLRLPWQRRVLAILADGSECAVAVYEATVIRDGRRRQIPVDEVPAVSLVGMALLDGHRLDMEVCANGKVVIRRLRRLRRR